MTDPDETANLVGGITQAYREYAAAEAIPVPGQVLGSDIEGQADALADASARLAELLTAFGREPRRSLDAIAVFRALSRAAGSMADAAAELRRQEWFDLDDEAGPEASAAWNGALEGMRSASGTFVTIADAMPLSTPSTSRAATRNTPTPTASRLTATSPRRLRPAGNAARRPRAGAAARTAGRVLIASRRPPLTTARPADAGGRG
jgi:hypothetical protein